ncbi:hypothetical protein I6A84_31550 [Frankia sp. CNm7]|uniref:Anaphase-promoting complex subunit 4 WD40 domain-containing protein n=1 Tax=Frankia nepalensis TaxID=1836974 RepID=A0A937REY5_9ACTN|nr:WD40 repeat domain-containing protein [Frankia nepalensis]MBL7498531.1 hypothetical protein [Frankia nepalensis]MBL7514308.1 hypothetical protein [Frankia nepalensis]MBL7522499.1 hypothetical protein [Frankia nepalensis]MBL7630888.1 hypothetical protein [Frankia nepalensis]
MNAFRRRASARTPASAASRVVRSPRRLAGALAAVAAATALVAAGLVVLDERVWPERGPDRAPAERASRLLAAEAGRVRGDDPDLARRLALAAYQTAPTGEARAALLTAYPAHYRRAAVLRGHSVTPRHLVFSPDGKLLASAAGDDFSEDMDGATGAHDNTARLWDTASRGSEAVAVLPHPYAEQAVFSPDGSLVVSVGSDATQLWDAASRGDDNHPLATFADGDLATNEAAFSPDGSLLATVNSDGAARLWDPARRGVDVPPLAVLNSGDSSMWHVAFSPDGRLVATADSAGAVRVWDTGRRGLVLSAVAVLIADPDDWITDVAFSPDGRFVATGASSGVARLWPATGGPEARPLATFLSGRDGGEVDVAFSPDGKLLAVTTDSGALLLDSAARGTGAAPLAVFAGHRFGVGAVAFSPDGRTLATGGGSEVQLWDPAARGPDARPVATLDHPDATTAVAFSPDGSLLATASGDNRLRLWAVDPDGTAAGACATPADRLTAAEWSRVVPDLSYRSPCR